MSLKCAPQFSHWMLALREKGAAVGILVFYVITFLPCNTLRSCYHYPCPVTGGGLRRQRVVSQQRPPAWALLVRLQAAAQRQGLHRLCRRCAAAATPLFSIPL